MVDRTDAIWARILRWFVCHFKFSGVCEKSSSRCQTNSLARMAPDDLQKQLQCQPGRRTRANRPDTGWNPMGANLFEVNDKICNGPRPEAGRGMKA
jgi:hypothetical protein